MHLYLDMLLAVSCDLGAARRGRRALQRFARCGAQALRGDLIAYWPRAQSNVQACRTAQVATRIYFITI